MAKYRVIKPTLDRFSRPLKVGDIIELDVAKVGSNLELIEVVDAEDVLNATTTPSRLRK